MDHDAAERAAEAFVADADPAMVIVTTAAGGERSGCLVGFWSQCSIEPLHLLVCISTENHTARVAASATALAVHLPSVDRDQELVELFGTETGDEADKFTRCSWRSGPHDVPLLDGLSYVVGEVIDRHPVGDHTAYVLAPIEGHHEPDTNRTPLSRETGLSPGHPRSTDD